MEPENENDQREEETTMSTTAVKKSTTAEMIVNTLSETEGPLSVEEIAKLTEANPTTLERALRKMLTEKKVVKFGNGKSGETAKYGLPPTRGTKGEIAGQVFAFLAARPDEDFSPYRIAKEIERFPGSVAWTCAKMASRGELVQVSDKPVKYRLP